MSVAYHLAKEKFGQILLLEKERLPGSGATAKAAGGIRAQFSTKVNIEMSMLSEKMFASFKDEIWNDALFDRVGYMFLLEQEKDIENFKRGYDLQKELGLNVEMLKGDDIRKLAPHYNLDNVRMATYCKDDGLGDPYEFMAGYESAARRAGVEIKYDTEVINIVVANDVIKSLKTKTGEISTPLIINCAGPQAKLIGQMAGVEIPVEPVKRQIVTTGELDFIEPFFPMVVNVKTGLYTHKESKGLLLGWADKNVESSFDISVDPDYTDNILERALNCIPGLETAEVGNQWAGLYEVTPDHHAIIGWEPELGGMFHVTGFSGHGFMQAPAAGLLTAELLTNKIPSIDISPLAPERFAKGALVDETNII